MYEKFHGPLPGNTTSHPLTSRPLTSHSLLTLIGVFTLVEHYDDFKQELHSLFPVVIDTKNLCFALRKVQLYSECAVVIRPDYLTETVRNKVG